MSWCASTHVRSTADLRAIPLTTTASVIKQQNHANGGARMLAGGVVDVRSQPAMRTAIAEDRVLRTGIKRSRRMMARQSQWLTRHQTQFKANLEEHGPVDRSHHCSLPNYQQMRRVQNPLFDAPGLSRKTKTSKHFSVLLAGSFDEMRSEFVTEQVGQQMQSLDKSFHRAILQRPERFGAVVYEMQKVAVFNGDNHLQPVTLFYEALCAAAAGNPSRWEVTKQQFINVAIRTAGVCKATAAKLFACLDPFDTSRIRLMQVIVPVFLAYRPELHEFEAILQCTRQDLAFHHLQHLYKMYAGIRGGMKPDDLKEILSCCLINETQCDDVREAIATVSNEYCARSSILQAVPGFEEKLFSEEQLLDLMRRHARVLTTTSTLMRSFTKATSEHVELLRQAARNSKH